MWMNGENIIVITNWIHIKKALQLYEDYEIVELGSRRMTDSCPGWWKGRCDSS